MEDDDLVKLAQGVGAVLVRAKALGEDSVAATLQMAFDELLEMLVADRPRLAQVSPELEEEGGE